ncbi:CBS domain-containing protein [Haloarchaeobius sp. HME9146]|uniref:CBS domain-containing protein n=1 Tax=Haloarchaeobius sp. HME9146 TaxID=2978732 RepID=UPI0021BF965E|nr:CBS domain-containing protein [Haloarchaeobius sp. HME9146]MCT9098289.1 CBS domain-containing protein [Haloarchaeobius sp. HME9146]
MSDVFVGSLMSSPVHTVDAETSIREAGQLLLDNGIGSAIVVDDDGKLEGILTSTDFVRVVAHGDEESAQTVGSSMTTDVITTTVNESIRTAADVMLEHGFHHLPVVDDENAVIGVVTTTDLTAYLSTTEGPDSL